MTLNEMTETTIPLPEGYTVRPACLDDAEAVSTLREAVALAMGNPDKVSPDDVRLEWTIPNFNLTESSRVIVSPDGQVIASVTVWDTYEPPVHPRIQWQVYPEHEDHDLGIFLLQWGEQRARQAIERCPADVRVAFRSGTVAGYAPRDQVFAAQHMTHVRNFYRMLIEMTEVPPIPQFPAGISVRMYNHPDELALLVRADMDSFRDHWGYVEQPFDNVYADWQHWVATDKLFDETLWFLAIDDATGAVAGVCLCRREDWEDPTAGYVDDLGVLPAYRKRGLGMALLHHAFGEFWKRGQPRVALGVDASSLTGAVRLYEKVGMHIDRQWAIYEKELRPGVEVSTTSVE